MAEGERTLTSSDLFEINIALRHCRHHYCIALTANQPFPQHVSQNRDLARVQLANAEAYLRNAVWAVSRGMQNHALHSIAIAVELALKSYLLNVATNDGWNRLHVGHDLDKAVSYAERAGLHPQVGLRELSAALHPHYQRGGFQRDPSRQWPDPLADEACQITRALLAEVVVHTQFQRDT